MPRHTQFGEAWQILKRDLPFDFHSGSQGLKSTPEHNRDPGSIPHRIEQFLRA